MASGRNLGVPIMINLCMGVPDGAVVYLTRKAALAAWEARK